MTICEFVKGSARAEKNVERERKEESTRDSVKASRLMFQEYRLVNGHSPYLNMCFVSMADPFPPPLGTSVHTCATWSTFAGLFDLGQLKDKFYLHFP